MYKISRTALNVIRWSRVVTHPLFEAVGEAGVVAPPDSLVVREAARPLRLEVEEAFREGIFVIMMR